MFVPIFNVWLSAMGGISDELSTRTAYTKHSNVKPSGSWTKHKSLSYQGRCYFQPTTDLPAAPVHPSEQRYRQDGTMQAQASTFLEAQEPLSQTRVRL